MLQAILGVSTVCNSAINPYIFLLFNSKSSLAQKLTSGCCPHTKPFQERSAFLKYLKFFTYIYPDLLIIIIGKFSTSLIQKILLFPVFLSELTLWKRLTLPSLKPWLAPLPHPTVLSPFHPEYKSLHSFVGISQYIKSHSKGTPNVCHISDNGAYRDKWK